MSEPLLSYMTMSPGHCRHPVWSVWSDTITQSSCYCLSTHTIRSIMPWLLMTSPSENGYVSAKFGHTADLWRVVTSICTRSIRRPTCLCEPNHQDTNWNPGTGTGSCSMDVGWPIWITPIGSPRCSAVGRDIRLAFFYWYSSTVFYCYSQKQNINQFGHCMTVPLLSHYVTAMLCYVRRIGDKCCYCVTVILLKIIFKYSQHDLLWWAFTKHPAIKILQPLFDRWL